MSNPVLSDGEKAAVRWLVILVGALGATGFVLSFEKVQRAVQPSFGSLAPLVPAGIDIGIAVFTGLDLLMARLDMRTRWLRLVPWCLVAVTVYLNVSGEPDLVGRVAHAAMPLLWVVAVEAGAHVVKVQAGLASENERMDRIRDSRWLLAPLSTVRLWRRMVLWEIKDYPDALGREQARLLALCDLKDEHGPVVWRWKAERRRRVEYRLGQLAPTRALPSRGSEPAPAPAPSPAPQSELEPPPRSNGQRVNGQSPRLNGDLRSVAKVVYHQIYAERGKVPRRPFIDAVRAQGFKLGSNKADQLLADLRDGEAGQGA